MCVVSFSATLSDHEVCCRRPYRQKKESNLADLERRCVELTLLLLELLVAKTVTECIVHNITGLTVWFALTHTHTHPPYPRPTSL